ncbi:MAG: UvrD-helicase domain-containing protein [Pirellulales bacterium]|nr:UvrD-helicase domain-containing protein [Pirellulales bacterium]
MTRASTTTRAVPRFPHQVIRASAGTGKTYQLSGRYLALAAAGQPLDEILATTFARKAAGEILERVLLRVAEAVDDPLARQALAEHVGAAQLAKPAACQELLARLVRQLHRLRVGTLDSFFVQLGGHFSLDLGLPPGWSIVDELEDARLRDEAIRRLFERGSLSDGDGATDLRTLLHLLSKGEVKRSLTEQVRDTVDSLYAIWRETKPEAWRRLQHRRELSEEELAAAVAGLAGQQLTKNLADARDADLVRFATGDWKKFIQTGIATKLAQGETTYSRKKIDIQLAEAYRPLVEHAGAKLINALVDQTVATARLLEHFHEEYWRLKLARRALRFEDVTRQLAEALAGDELDAVGFRLDAEVRHLLLDEFQDTSLAQWGVLQPFGEAVTRQAGGSFFCVGDAKQAIYGWRGGVAEIFDLVDQQLPGLTRETLATSYRSSPVIIDVVNQVFGTLASNEELADTPAVGVNWSRHFTRHTTAKADLPGYACLEVAPHPVSDEKVEVATLRYAAVAVARWARECPGRSIGVLVRTNKAIARLIYELRTHHDVLASEEGGNPLVDSVAVQTVLSLLRLADHPGDTTARFHVATSPLGTGVGFIDFRDAEAARRLSRAVREALLERGYGPVLYDWARLLAPSCDERQLRRLLQLVELGYAYEPQTTLRGDDFVQLVETQKVEDPTTASVRVMTVHQAKGLEFDIVVLPELDRRLRGQVPRLVVGREGAVGPVERVCRYAAKEVAALLPAEFRQMFERWPSEEAHAALCLLYVAMTRAAHALHMIVCDPALPYRGSKTLAALVRRAVAPGAAPQNLPAVIFETGKRDWHHTAGKATENATSENERAAPSCGEPAPLRLRPALRMRNIERRSPSRLAGSVARPLADVLRPPDREATARGSLQHAWYEAIGWLEEGLPSDDALRAIAERELLPGLDVEAELQSFHAALAKPAIRDVLSRRDYESPDTLGLPSAVCAELSAAPCELVLDREWGFLLDEDGTLLQGAIDRLVVWRRNDRALWADVIDFKTNVVRDAAAEDELVEHYRPQLDAYRRAISRAFELPVERTSARLVLVSRGSVRML